LAAPLLDNGTEAVFFRLSQDWIITLENQGENILRNQVEFRPSASNGAKSIQGIHIPDTYIESLRSLCSGKLARWIYHHVQHVLGGATPIKKAILLAKTGAHQWENDDFGISCISEISST